ncbi:MAG: galactokinase [bacterium]|nr:galactokinase [bacterium]
MTITLHLSTLTSQFKVQFGSLDNLICIRSPGRVNLIGEHTDYNDGFVLPIAIDRAIYILAQPRSDNKVNLYSMNYLESAEFTLETISPTSPASWVNYPKGVLSLLFARRLVNHGFNALIYGDIPVGAGLSSSAALELAIAYTVQELSGCTLAPLDMIKLCQQAENEFVGVQCGIMDQFIIRLAKEHTALFIDCRTLHYEYIPIPNNNIRVVICDSGVKRGLINSEYNLRQEQCKQGVSLLKSYFPNILALRDVCWTDFINVQNNLPELVRKRARHVISENQRVLDAVKVLQENNIPAFGQLMNESHKSLKHDYEVSCPELDILVSLAQQFDGCFGSRMTGAGFGGCTVSIVHSEVVERFIDYIQAEYQKATKIKPEIYLTSASSGVSRLFLEI